ncbi:hypothetical protein [Halorubellus litoreus]|uniref:Uncharacterized protein n=1 Tax=Halorubellus litoreus TaxID=755308 RepID=A0ABD5VG71_9EURY
MGANWLYLAVEPEAGADRDALATVVTDDNRLSLACEHGDALVFVGPGDQVHVEDALDAAGDAVERASLAWEVDSTGYSAGYYYERHDGEVLTVDVHGTGEGWDSRLLVDHFAREYGVDVAI